MLPVYLCEDDRTQLKELSEFIENTILIEELDMRLACSASSPEQLLAVLSVNPIPSMYFLDVELKASINGFQLAEQIRRYDPRGFVVFITTHSEMSPLTFEYRVEAMDYILKDDVAARDNKIRDCLLKAQELYSSPSNTTHHVVTLKIGTRTITVRLEEIYGIETVLSDGHFLCIETKSGFMDYFCSLKAIRKLLDDRFFQCHKSCIINLDHVREIDSVKHIVTLDNGSFYPVSLRLHTALVHALETRNSLEEH